MPPTIDQPEPQPLFDVRLELTATHRAKLAVMAATKGVTRSAFVADLTAAADRHQFAGQAGKLVSTPATETPS